MQKLQDSPEQGGSPVAWAWNHRPRYLKLSLRVSTLPPYVEIPAGGVPQLKDQHLSLFQVHCEAPLLAKDLQCIKHVL